MKRKLLAIVLALSLCLSMGVTAFAASGPYTAFYTGQGLQDGYNLRNNLTGTNAIKNSTVDLGEIYAEDKRVVNIGLYNTMFVDKNGVRGGYDASGKALTTPLVPVRLTAAEIRSAKIALRTQSMSGSKVFQSITLDNRNGQIKVKFIEEWVSTKEQDFEVSVNITINEKRVNSTALTIMGTMYNREVSVYKDYDYIDLSNQSIAIAEDSVSKIEVELGNGVSIHTRLIKGKKYYGTATYDTDNNDVANMEKYPDIDSVLTLKTVGLNATGNIVQLEQGLGGYYVYDANLKYLGRGNQRLPYSTKYYLANRQLSGISTSTSSGSSSSSSTSSTGSASRPTIEDPTTDEALTLSEATSLFNAKLKNKPASQKTLSVIATNKSGVSQDVLKGIKSLADKAGVKATLIIDQKSGKSVQTRMYIDTTKYTKSMNTLITINTESTKATETQFSKWYKNDVFVVGTNQKGDFGMTVEIAVKAPTGLRTRDLYFYSYNRTTNKVTRIQNPQYSVDGSGYLHFYTKSAGEIIISDGALSK